jgi:hypothetical protein
VRLRFGVAMPEKGGRPAIVGAEVFLKHGEDKRRRWHFTVGYVERVRSQTIQGADQRVRELILPVTDVRPCAFVDVGTAQGFALRRMLRQDWPEKDSHRPHAYERTKFDNAPFAAFLEAYADGRVRFREDLPHRKELDRALILFRSGGTSQAGDELDSEDEALVHALCLSIMFPSHGAEPSSIDPKDPPPPSGVLGLPA